MATQAQIDWLKGLSDYVEVAERIGEYTNDNNWVGPGGKESGWFAKVVPQTAWGICLKPAAYLHDDDYGQGGNEADRFKADARFLANMMKQIEIVCPQWWQAPRRHLARVRALKYFEAVRAGGKKHFG